MGMMGLEGGKRLHLRSMLSSLSLAFFAGGLCWLRQDSALYAAMFLLAYVNLSTQNPFDVFHVKIYN